MVGRALGGTHGDVQQDVDAPVFPHGEVLAAFVLCGGGMAEEQLKHCCIRADAFILQVTSFRSDVMCSKYFVVLSERM